MSLGETVRAAQVGKRQGSQRSGKREMLGKFGGSLLAPHLISPCAALGVFDNPLFRAFQLLQASDLK